MVENFTVACGVEVNILNEIARRDNAYVGSRAKLAWSLDLVPILKSPID